MILRTIADLSQRPVSNLEVLFKYIFGDKFPQEFIENKHYKAGDLIITIDKNGNSIILECKVAGSYTKEDLFTSSWSNVTITEIVNNSSGVKDIIGSLSDYKGGVCKTVIGVTNNLYDRVLDIITDFPTHGSTVDGGLFEESGTGELTPEDIAVHDSNVDAHDNIAIDGNITLTDIQDMLLEKEGVRLARIYGGPEPEMSSKSKALLEKHNTTPIVHLGIKVDGNLGSDGVIDAFEESSYNQDGGTFGDEIEIHKVNTLAQGMTILDQHNINPNSHSRLIIDGNEGNSK